MRLRNINLPKKKIRFLDFGHNSEIDVGIKKPGKGDILP